VRARPIVPIVVEDRVPEAYDFRRPTTLTREQSRTLELAFETFARQWGTQLTAKVRLMSRVTFQQLLVWTYGDYVASLPETTGLVLCRTSEGEARAIVQFPTGGALGWISSMLGGVGNVGVTDRRWTVLEQSLVRRLVDDLLEDLRYSFGETLTAELAVDSVHFTTQFAQAAPTSEMYVVAAFTVKVGESSMPATIALPAGLVVPHVGVHAAPHATELPQLVEHVSWAPVDVAVRLRPTDITPSAVLDLAVGDVIRLDHPHARPFEVTIDGQTLARAAVGSVGARLAAVVVDTEEVLT